MTPGSLIPLNRLFWQLSQNPLGPTMGSSFRCPGPLIYRERSLSSLRSFSSTCLWNTSDLECHKDIFPCLWIFFSCPIILILVFTFHVSYSCSTNFQELILGTLKWPRTIAKDWWEPANQKPGIRQHLMRASTNQQCWPSRNLYFQILSSRMTPVNHFHSSTTGRTLAYGMIRPGQEQSAVFLLTAASFHWSIKWHLRIKPELHWRSLFQIWLWKKKRSCFFQTTSN